MGHNFLDSSVDMSVGLVSVEDMVLSNSDEQVAWGYILQVSQLISLFKYQPCPSNLNTVSSCDDPFVCQECGTTFVLELPTLVLTKRYLHANKMGIVTPVLKPMKSFLTCHGHSA